MINMEENNTTIDYYNHNAERYFADTVTVDMSECCDRFLKYINPGGRIIDIGVGSGRDIKYFLNKDFIVEGIDASEEMCRLASNYSGIEVQCVRIQDWHPNGKFDGIWANASLLHLPYTDIADFICRSSEYLNTGGALYISVKHGIQTGYDGKGRYFTVVSEEKVQHLVSKSTAYILADSWISEDSLNRNDSKWLNIIMQKR